MNALQQKKNPSLTKKHWTQQKDWAKEHLLKDNEKYLSVIFCNIKKFELQYDHLIQETIGEYMKDSKTILFVTAQKSNTEQQKVCEFCKCFKY